MMKLKRGLVLVETTDPASASGLLDKLALNVATALGNRCDVALDTAKTAIPPSEERRATVLRATQDCVRKTRCPSRLAFPATHRALSLEPLPP